MKVKYFQENHTFELVGGSSKSKAWLLMSLSLLLSLQRNLNCILPVFIVISSFF